jgi:hypothetical protein
MIKTIRDFEKSTHVIVFISDVPVFIRNATVIIDFAFIKWKKDNDYINFVHTKEGNNNGKVSTKVN